MSSDDSSEVAGGGGRLAQSRSSYSQFTAVEGPTISFSLYSTKLDAALKDFFYSNNSSGFVSVVKSLSNPRFNDTLVLRAVRLALDEDVVAQQSTAEMLTLLFDAKLITTQHATRAFEKLIQSVDDVCIDVPAAGDDIMTFIECAVEDRLLDESFVQRLPISFLMILTKNEGLTSPRLEGLEASLRDYKISSKKFVDESDVFAAVSGVSGAEECRQFFSENPSPDRRHEFVKLFVAASLSKTKMQREVVSRVLSELYGTGMADLTSDDIQFGFCRLIGNIADLTLDNPNASELISKFLVRAIVDEIIPPVFVWDSLRLHIGGHEGMALLSRCRRWLTEETPDEPQEAQLEHRRHALSARFRKIWLGTDPDTPDGREFKAEVRSIAFDFFDGRDKGDAVERITLLNLSPDQADEMVRKLLVFSMERDVSDSDAALDLIAFLVKSDELNEENVARGVDQAFRFLDDLTIDVPGAPAKLRNIVTTAKAKNILPSSFEDPLTRERRLLTES